MLIRVAPHPLTAEQKRKAVRKVNIIKLKRSGNLKGRMCDNGAPNHKSVTRKEEKSPAINMQGLLSTMVIDAYEDRKVATFDLPGAYLQI